MTNGSKYLITFFYIVLMFASFGLQANQRAMDTILFKTDKLTVRPDATSSFDNWCTPKKYDTNPEHGILIRYDAPHAERDALFEPGLEQFIRKNIVPALTRHCPGVRKFRLGMMRKGETSYWDVIGFIIKDGAVLRTFYRPGYDAKKAMSEAEIQAMMPRETVLERVDLKLYADANVTVYPHQAAPDDYRWCIKAEIDVVYDHDHSQRQKWFGKPAEFAGRVLLPILKQYCTDLSPSITAYFYKSGEVDYWEKMDFYFSNPMTPRSGSGIKATFARVESHKMGKVAALQSDTRKSKIWGKPCNNGPFCSLPGSSYLQAIYDNDFAQIREFDAIIYRQAKAKLLEDEKKTGLNFVGVTFTRDLEKNSFLPALADSYMYQYQNLSRLCIKDNAHHRGFKKKTDKIKFENLYGIEMGSIDAINIQVGYVVNPEFAGLLERIGSSSPEGGAQFVSRRSFPALYTLQGLERINKKFYCNSDEVKRFERNLISLTTQYLGNQTASPASPINKTKTTTANIATSSKQVAVSEIPAKMPSGSVKYLAAGWIAQIDNSKVELVLWPNPKKPNRVHGYIYVEEYDCLILAQLFKYKEQIAFEFGSTGIYLRKNNCKINTNGSRFQGSGYTDLNKLPDTFDADFPFLYFAGKSLVDPGNPKKTIITFTRSAISPKMHEFVSTYKHKFIQPPNSAFLSDLKVRVEP